MIKVERKGENEFLVVVEEGGSKTEHIVTLDQEYYEQLTGGKITKEKLVEESFKFLLEREPKESILRRFNLKVINRYFPEYEETISRKIRH
ncbi:hypothetical protein DRO38_02305 [Candidatus Bathyarchaeota archaeon]|nr:MAG: hypothetical protein DRO38_02305 [Candidatus Bathyarchaeota archaeon]